MKRELKTTVKKFQHIFIAYLQLYSRLMPKYKYAKPDVKDAILYN